MAGLALAGCSSTPKGPEVGRGSFDGPPISVSSSGAVHQAVVQAPSPGWFVRLDETVQTADATEAYISLVQPNPEMVYTQQIVEQRLNLGVGTENRLALFARVIPFSEKSGSSAAYSRVELAGR